MSRKPLRRFGRLHTKTPKMPNYTEGIKPPLLAKSKNRGGDDLVKHSFEAACMALTVSTNIVVDDVQKDQLYRSAFVAGLFHDLGKGAAGFQEMIKLKDVRRWPKDQGGFRHEMMSALLIILNLKKLPTWSQREIQAIFLSVIVHHKPYRKMKNYPKPIPKDQWPNNISFKQMVVELEANSALLKKVWKKLIKLIKEDKWGSKLLEEGYLPSDLEIPSSTEEADRLFAEFIDAQGIPGYHRGFIDERILREKLNPYDIKFISFVRAAVTVGDHLASGKYLFVPPKPNLVKINPLDPSHTPRGFQEKVRNIRGNLLLRAPTGSGKTEASFMWIQQNQKLNMKQYGKVFFVLPFQASINAMYQRLNRWLGVKGGIVGTQHSRAANFLFDLFSSELYTDKGKPKKSEFQEYGNPWDEIENLPIVPKLDFSNFILDEGYQREIKASKRVVPAIAYAMDRLTQEIFYPVKVTTPHQLLAAALGGKGWEVRIQDFEGACIVFDEIHTYDPHMTGLVLGLSNMLINQFGCRILFMSASFPQILIDKIHEFVDPKIEFVSLDESHPEDEKILNKERHILEIQDTPLTQYCNTIEFKNKINSVESTLIICNTVSTAQEVFQSIKSTNNLSDEEIMLFHSRFKIEDRKEKERKLHNIKNNKLQVVVATQVVEVSLDIDLELGLIEAAPLDALIQRFGRVNRAGNRLLENTNIVIFPTEGYSDLIYQSQLTDTTLSLLQKKEGMKISETDLVDMLNNLYTKHPWSENEEREFRSAFNHNNYQNFFKTAVPGTYNRWIDTVITDKSTQDIILREDIPEFKKRYRKSPLIASDLIIPTRVTPKNLEWVDKKLPPVLNMDHKYSKELGLIKL